ncbi:MAG: hypothetical protein JSU03_09115 [Bacteroidetes bacterium]|nr:hypothetical protein [Bacteroidota bacterium]MBS1757424.1 hypothetical protein [Bacteroidota bacterium]
MQKSIFIFLTAIIILNITARAQQITYSDINKDDNKRISFDILGKFDSTYLVYKKVNNKHYITIYDKDMHITNTVRLDFITSKTINIDFVKYSNDFLLFYQYQKGSIVYCNAAKVSSTGQLIGNVKLLDTAKTNLFESSNIYSMINSEDKQKIILSKIQRKNGNIAFTQKMYDSSFQMLDSSRFVFDYNDRKDTYSDIELANDGTYMFTKEIGNYRNDYSKQLLIYYHPLHSDTLITKEILLDDKYVENVKIKVDNLNNQIVVAAFSISKKTGNTEGIFTAKINKANFAITNKAIMYFSDSTLDKLSGRPSARTAFNDFALPNIIFKKNGGFILTVEEYYTQGRNNRWNSRDYLYSPYYFNSPYYYNYPGYYGYNYYRYDPFYRFNSNQDIVYNYNDVLIFSFDPSLVPEWNNIINKKQSDLNEDQFLSYATINMGAELHYLFIQKDNNREVISDHALQSNGEMIRYPTIRGGESGYDFMPRLAKQVGAKQIIVPCLHRGTICFAKIDFF